MVKYCRTCGVDLRLYTNNDSSAYSCVHIGAADERIVKMLYREQTGDMVAIIERLQKVVDELERRVYGTGGYRTPG